MTTAAVGVMACGGPLEVEPRPAPAVRVAGRLNPTRPGRFGTSNILFVRGGSYRYGWVAFCQARADTNGDGWIAAGDRFMPFLATSGGAGEAIDAYLGRDPSGRYAAFARAHRLFVVDAMTRRVFDIGPARDADMELAFDHHGRLAYVRDNGYQRDVILVDLTTLVERPLRGTRGLIRMLDFSGQYEGLYVDEKLQFEEVVEDTNGNGHLDRYVAGLDRSPCALPERPWCHFGEPRPDEGRRVAIPLGDLRVRYREEEVTIASWYRFHDECAPPATPALAISSEGAALVALGGYTDQMERNLSSGPLEWRRPIPRSPCVGRSKASTSSRPRVPTSSWQPSTSM
jgi:hypothetical protein